MYYYKKVKNGNIVSIEAKSNDVLSPHFVKATEQEYNSFIASLPPVIKVPVRDYGKEIDDLTVKVNKLKRR